ncbi:MAG: tyrosine-type recombinase/integrase [Clostridiales bacterium]|jgi:site-specific recombinase XerD|nr:tyrosine-type recombinase/integrase [Clostridiales bacterium]
MSAEFYNQRNLKCLDRIAALRKALPLFVGEFLLGIEQRTTPLTRLNYCYDLKTFFDFLCREVFFGKAPTALTLSELNAVTTSQLEQYVGSLSHFRDDGGKRHALGERAKSRHLSCIKSMFKYFFRKERLASNVSANVDLPKLHDKEIVRLEVDEVVRLLNTAEDGSGLTARQQAFHAHTAVRDVALLTLLLGTGIRISECVGLNVSDLDFSTGGFRVIRKGGGSTVLYFSDEIADALKKYLAVREALLDPDGEKNALFISLHHARISVRAVQLLVKKYSEVATPLKHITPHKLRSTYGTALYRETKDIYIVADVLGHRDINTTKKHYAAISEDIRRGAAGKVKLRDDDIPADPPNKKPKKS